jgi:TRAPP trafficking subunit Trs65
LHAMQKHAALEPAEIICYGTDVRVGPLAPSACHTIELHFVALRSGVIELDAVRVIDLVNQEHVDIRDLPSIIISPSL